MLLFSISEIVLLGKPVPVEEFQQTLKKTYQDILSVQNNGAIVESPMFLDVQQMLDTSQTSIPQQKALNVLPQVQKITVPATIKQTVTTLPNGKRRITPQTITAQPTPQTVAAQPTPQTTITAQPTPLSTSENTAVTNQLPATTNSMPVETKPIESPMNIDKILNSNLINPTVSANENHINSLTPKRKPNLTNQINTTPIASADLLPKLADKVNPQPSAQRSVDKMAETQENEEAQQNANKDNIENEKDKDMEVVGEKRKAETINPPPPKKIKKSIPTRKEDGMETKEKEQNVIIPKNFFVIIHLFQFY